MTLTRWQRTDGWRPAGFWQQNSLTDEVGALFDAFTSALENPGAWSPAVDLYENQDLVTVQAELPGLRKEDIDITLQDDALVLSGTRTRVRPGQNAAANAEVKETFNRAITLPYKVNQAAITASYVDGVLTVQLPKAEEAKPKRIEVKFN